MVIVDVSAFTLVQCMYSVTLRHGRLCNTNVQTDVTLIVHILQLTFCGF